jgi:1-acyl-sn-glycerol-3-phosphate acyltransferase
MRDARTRRAVTVPAVATTAAVLGGSVGLWAPVAAAVDLVTKPKKMPRLRLLSFALTWSTLESVGVGASAVLWATGHGADETAHYALQRWWAARLVDALRRIAGASLEINGLELLAPGPVVMCARHASIADSLMPAWLLGQVGMRPRYVLKDDLQLDPCLDIVGNRLPNHFVDRDPDDSAAELALVETLARGMRANDAAVIFPEGGVVTDARRRRAIETIAGRDHERGKRVRDLQTLGPVRPGGTAALLRGAPDADLVFVTHTGFEQLQRLADAPGSVPLQEPIRVEITRVPRTSIPSGPAFVEWLDGQWSQLDRRITSPAFGTRRA